MGVLQPDPERPLPPPVMDLNDPRCVFCHEPLVTKTLNELGPSLRWVVVSACPRCHLLYAIGLSAQVPR